MKATGALVLQEQISPAGRGGGYQYESITWSTPSDQRRLARRYLRRQGLKPIYGSGKILPDGTVAVPLINGAVAHVAFTTVTTMHLPCRGARRRASRRRRSGVRRLGQFREGHRRRLGL